MGYHYVSGLVGKAKKREMKVLTIFNSANMGGIEKTLISYLKNKKSTDIEMYILCFRRGGTLENTFKELGVKFLYIKKTGLIFFDMIQLLFLIFKYKFDIVHSRFGFTSGGFVLASLLTSKKVFVSIHSKAPSSFKKYERSKFLSAILGFHLKIHKFITQRFATKIIGHSKSNLNENFPNWKSDPKFELIYNGVDFDELDRVNDTREDFNHFIDKESFVILNIGSFRAPKNHLFLIDCFYSLKPVENNLKLVLVGSGSLMEKVKEKVNHLGISDHVFFAGFDPQTKKYFENSNLFFLPSLNEGLANVLIEAQYKELPICVSDIPPLYESGYKGYHKYYFNPEEIESAVGRLNEMIQLIRDKELDETKKAAKEYVMNTFSIDTMVSKLEELYRGN